MAITVSLINMKGGVGKSTLSVNLAWHFAAYSDWLKKILVVDLDPQFNASQYLVGVTKYQEHLSDGKPTMWEILEQHTRTPTGKVGVLDPQDAIRKVRTIMGGGKIDLIPSRLELSLSLKNSGHKVDLLQKALKKVESDYDLIIIDCAPTESILTTAAYLASNYILVPVKPEYLSTIGLPLLVNSMEDFIQQYDDSPLELAGIVFNGCSGYAPEEARSKGEVKKMAAINGWHVFNSEISYSKSYPKGAREGQPIFRTSYARTTAASNFRQFASEFAIKIGLI
ncbi:MAG: ParA family protein [Pseudomonadota bacterium]